LKSKNAGDLCRKDTIEKRILRVRRARTFSHSLGHEQTSSRRIGMCALTLKAFVVHFLLRS
jgi:hypothetical protein